MPNEKPNALVVVGNADAAKKLATAIIERPESTANLPDDVRRVRRGQFFMSYQEQLMHGSLTRPIFQYYFHGVVVGEERIDELRSGIVCYGAHKDFELIPEFIPPSQWPEYIRTKEGFARKPPDSAGALPDFSVDEMLTITADQKRLK